MIGRHRVLKARRRLLGIRNTAEEAESWDEWMASAGGLQLVDQASAAPAAG